MVLHNLSFHIKSGQRIGVGTSGPLDKFLMVNLTELSRQDGQWQSMVLDFSN